MYVCPICGNPMHMLSHTFVKCDNCSVFVDLKEVKVTTGPGVEPHVLESLKFLQLCNITQPCFVLSPYKLFDKSFTIAECVFYDPKIIDPDINAMDMNQQVNMNNMHLIAGAGMYSHGFLDLFYLAISNEYTVNPFFVEEFCDKDKAFWLFTLISSAKVSPDSTLIKLANSYFSPSLEFIIDNLFNIGMSVDGADLTDEKALYGLLSNTPQINIGWDIGKDGISECLYKYVSACLNDLESINKIKYREPVKLESIKGLCLNNFEFDFKRAYYKSMPSLALNTDTGETPTFDILNQEFTKDYFSGYCKDVVDARMVTSLYGVYITLGKLWEKYACDQKRYGVRYKERFLKKRLCKISDNIDELVLLFWKEMKKVIYNEET